MLLEYLKENYKENEPIFTTDIALPVKDNHLRQMFKILCDKGVISRYEAGIYYFPSESRIKGGPPALSAGQVAKYKYIERNGKIDGYYSGYTFANQLGLTTQVPFIIEIATNQASATVREVSIRNQKVILRRPKAQISEDNCKVLQLLDLLKDFDKYSEEGLQEGGKILDSYVRKSGIRRESVDEYIELYPDRVYKYIYELKLYEAFA